MSETPTAYNPVTETIVEQLKAIVGEKYVIYGEAEKLEAFSHDEVAGAAYAHMPLCVSPEALDMMRSVKVALDPNNVPNPGKVFEA